MIPPKDLQTISALLCQFAQTNLVAAETSLDENCPLADVGIDSFALVELLLFGERTFGIRVPESHLTRKNLASVATLAACILGLASSSAPSPSAGTGTSYA